MPKKFRKRLSKKFQKKFKKAKALKLKFNFGSGADLYTNLTPKETLTTVTHKTIANTINKLTNVPGIWNSSIRNFLKIPSFVGKLTAIVGKSLSKLITIVYNYFVYTRECSPSHLKNFLAIIGIITILILAELGYIYYHYKETTVELVIKKITEWFGPKMGSRIVGTIYNSKAINNMYTGFTKAKETYDKSNIKTDKNHEDID